MDHLGCNRTCGVVRVPRDRRMIRPARVLVALWLALAPTCGATAVRAESAAPPPTATPCSSSGAQLELRLSAAPAAPLVGEVVDLAVEVRNPSGGLAGLPSYSLTGAEPLFAVELVERSYPLAQFARYRLTALQAGRTELVAAVHYETAHRCFGFDTFFFRSSTSDPFPIEVHASGPTPTPTATPLAPTATCTATPSATLTPSSNRPPPVAVVRVTPNPAVSGQRVGFDSAGSSGAIQGRYWRQIGGEPVELQGCHPAERLGCFGDTAWFTAPAVAGETTLRFELLLTSFGSTPWDQREFDVTILPAPPCPGDCNGDGVVTVNEVVTAVGIALGVFDLATCPAVDTDRSSTVTIDELIVSLLGTLSACSAG